MNIELRIYLFCWGLIEGLCFRWVKMSIGTKQPFCIAEVLVEYHFCDFGLWPPFSDLETTTFDRDCKTKLNCPSYCPSEPNLTKNNQKTNLTTIFFELPPLGFFMYGLILQTSVSFWMHVLANVPRNEGGNN